MMKLKSIAFLLMTIAMPAMAEQISVNSKGISLVLDVENGKPAQYLYFGTKLNDAGFGRILKWLLMVVWMLILHMV